MKKTIVFAMGAVCGGLVVKYYPKAKNWLSEKYDEAKAKVEETEAKNEEGENFEPVKE